MKPRARQSLVAALDPDRATAASAIAPPEEGELLVVVGPTASGKTALAIDLAERFGGEIVSADSVQIYRDFELGTGKPTAAELARAPHHLVARFDALEPVDAAVFARAADEAIADIRARGLVPIVCGGTFLWVKALVHGLAEAPPADPEVRARHQAIAASDGRAALHARLAAIDPDAAARLAPNDLLRVSRALEVFELTNKPMSAWQAEHRFESRRHASRLIGVARAGEEIDRRIADRTRTWLAMGWVDEVRALLERGYGEARAMGSVGFRQIRAHLAGELAAVDLEVAIVRATRVFARRQRTWLRDEAVRWVRGEAVESP